MAVTRTKSTITSERDVVECTRCREPMRVVPSAKTDLHYFVCPRCRTRLASAYQEVLRAGTAARVRRDRPDESAGRVDAWARIRERAERFQSRLEATDPYRVLDLPPSADLGAVRARYHELAARHHPDRGGDPERMRRVIDAYKIIRGKIARAPF